MSHKKIDYKSAGVDIDAGNVAVDLIKDKVKTTFSRNVLTGLGSFGSLFSLKSVSVIFLIAVIYLSLPNFLIKKSALCRDSLKTNRRLSNSA